MSTLPKRPTDPDPSSYLKYLISIILHISLFLNYQLEAQQPLGSTIYFSHDNDILKIINGTDRYYSFGLIAGYQKALSHEKVDFLPTQHFKDPRNKYIIGVVAAIKGYTPNSEDNRENSLLERPFAGTFTIRPYLISVNRNHLIRLDLETGIRGPASHAGRLQNWVHEKIGDDRIKGWDNQLDNKFLFNLYGQYAKPFLIIKGFEVIPESTVALGNHFTYLQQGIKIRVGLFNDISNSISYVTHTGGRDAVRKMEIFTSVTLYGRISLVDATLSSSNMVDDLPMITRDNLMAGFRLRFNFLINRFGVILAYSKITPRTNLSEKHSYGSIGLNYGW